VPGIDIIVDGHSHSKFDVPQKIEGVYIVTANEWGKFMGQGKLSIVDGKLTRFDWHLAEITGAPDRAAADLLAPYIAEAEASLKEVIGEAADTFIFGNRLPRYGETALGNMIADAFVWYFKTRQNQNIDFAFQNSGGIRAELPKGKLTREHILTVLPFGNSLYIASFKGSQILELFDHIASIPQGNGAFPQFSKEVRYSLDADGRMISNLTIGGAPVDPERIYRFCANDYLLGGGDGYTVLTQASERYNTSLLLSYVVIEYIRSRDGIITPFTDGRMIVTGGVTP
jgi:5'-nucleotidase/UDP-sugar diphosphatase